MSDRSEAAVQFVKRLIRPEIQQLSAYHVPESKGLLKADAMENPYCWPDEMKQRWLECLADVEINRYPDPHAKSVVEGLKKAMNIDSKWGVLLGNGSDEIIQMLAMAVAADGAKILAPEPGFIMYRMTATFVGMEFVSVPLAEDFGLDAEFMLNAIETHQPALIFLAQPNNPTGNLFSWDVVEAVIKASAGLVVLDEAYTAFTDADSLFLLEKYPNVVVMRTVSKVGLAGLRLGLLVGSKEWIQEVDKLRLPYNINTLTQASAEFALQNYSLLEQQAASIRQSRTLFYQRLSELNGLKVRASETNFLLVTVAVGKGKVVHQQLKERGILVKCLDGSHPLLADTLRITVGSDDDNNRIVAELSELI